MLCMKVYVTNIQKLREAPKADLVHGRLKILV